MIKKLLLGLSVVAFACAGAALAQQGGIKRTPLQKAEFPDGYVSISGIAEIPAGGTAGRHTHPGVELGYVMEGEGRVQSRGEEIVTIRPGDVIFTNAEECHWHGAAPDHFMMHLSMTEGGANWAEHVTDAEYGGGETS